MEELNFGSNGNHRIVWNSVDGYYENPNYDGVRLGSMELYGLKLQKIIADFTEFDAVTKAYVDKQVEQAKLDLTDGASAALDTFKELEEYLEGSETASGLVDQISALSAAITAEVSRASGIEGGLGSRVNALENDTSSATGISALQSELDATQHGAGLDLDGAYVADAGRNYISGATSLKSADALLDTALNAEKVAREAAVTAERLRAQTAEEDNFAAITNKHGEAIHAVTNERLRAQGVETTLNSRIADQEAKQALDNTSASADRTAIRNELEDQVGEERDRAEGVEASLQSIIGEEEKRAADAELALSGRVGVFEEGMTNGYAEGNPFYQGGLSTQAVVDQLRGAVDYVNGERVTDKATADSRHTASEERHDDSKARLDGHDGDIQGLGADIQTLGERPHNEANGGFGIQHIEGSPDNKYLYFSQRWRLHGSSSGDRLIFEYNQGTSEEPLWKSAIPFISH